MSALAQLVMKMLTIHVVILMNVPQKVILATLFQKYVRITLVVSTVTALLAMNPMVRVTVQPSRVF